MPGCGKHAQTPLGARQARDIRATDPCLKPTSSPSPPVQKVRVGAARVVLRQARLCQQAIGLKAGPCKRHTKLPVQVNQLVTIPRRPAAGVATAAAAAATVVVPAGTQGRQNPIGPLWDAARQGASLVMAELPAGDDC